MPLVHANRGVEATGQGLGRALKLALGVNERLQARDREVYELSAMVDARDRHQ